MAKASEYLTILKYMAVLKDVFPTRCWQYNIHIKVVKFHHDVPFMIREHERQMPIKLLLNGTIRGKKVTGGFEKSTN